MEQQQIADALLRHAQWHTDNGHFFIPCNFCNTREAVTFVTVRVRSENDAIYVFDACVACVNPNGLGMSVGDFIPPEPLLPPAAVVSDDEDDEDNVSIGQ